MSSGLVIDTAWKAFGSRPILKGAFAWAKPGKVTLLLGSNGCGKSTLLRCCTGLLKWEQGACFIDGGFVRPHLSSLAGKGVFFWPDANLFSRRRTVGWHLRAVRDGRSGPPSDLEEACEPFLNHRPDEMSGGELRRCELAVVTAAEPRFLLADEPLLGTAPQERERVCAALRAMAERGVGVLVTGHEVDDLLALTDDVIWMTGGRTSHIGSAQDAKGNWHFRRDYLAGRAAFS